jgi:hypothetical protein
MKPTEWKGYDNFAAASIRTRAETAKIGENPVVFA